MTKLSKKEYDELVVKYNALVKPFNDFRDILSSVADKEKKEKCELKTVHKKEFTTISNDRNSQTITFDIKEMPEIVRDDRSVAWEIYVELITRVTTQSIPDNADIKEALNSIYKVFNSTRRALVLYGPNIRASTMLAVPMLNNTMRPFLTKWHTQLPGTIESHEQFLTELRNLQEVLAQFAAAFLDISNGKRSTLQIKLLPAS